MRILLNLIISGIVLFISVGISVLIFGSSRGIIVMILTFLPAFFTFRFLHKKGVLKDYQNNILKGKNLMNSGNYIEALEYFDKAKKTKASESLLFYYRGECYYFLHKYDYAVVEYNKVEYYSKQSELNRVIKEHGSEGLDKKYIEKMSFPELEINYKNVYLHMAISYKKLENFELSEENFYKALLLDPNIKFEIEHLKAE